MKIADIKRKVLSKIKPSDAEIRRVERFLVELKEVARIVSSPHGKPMVCGSMGKGTWISKNYDIDLFIVFPTSFSRKELEKRGLEVGKKIIEELGGKWIVKYAEHPYVRGNVKGFDIDIVPCYEMKPGERIRSAVDRSPLHTIYIVQHLDEKARDEVRLLKKFFKSLKVYGSDTKTEGVSGYILEILVIKFGTFENVLSFFSKANFGEVVDVENYWKGSPPKKLRHNYPFVVIDPTDKNRNAAAALSAQNFYLIKKYSQMFLENPSDKFFFLKEKSLTGKDVKNLISRGTYFVALTFPRPDVIDDTLYPQMRRSSSRIASMFRFHGFDVIRAFVGANEKKCLILFEIVPESLPEIEKRSGPIIFSKIHTKQFLEKYKNDTVYIEDNRWIVEKKRTYRRPKELLKSIKGMSVKHLKEIGIASHVAESFSKARILDGKSMWDFVRKEFGKEIRKFYFGIL